MQEAVVEVLLARKVQVVRVAVLLVALLRQVLPILAAAVAEHQVQMRVALAAAV
jgi:hypothetical protein